MATGNKQLKFRSEAREKILRGAGALADAIRITLGPRSKCVLIEKTWGRGFREHRAIFALLSQLLEDAVHA